MKCLFCGLILVACLGSCFLTQASPTYILSPSNVVCVTSVPAGLTSWVTVNADSTLQNPNAWIASTWDLPQEGRTIYPYMSMNNGVAVTELKMNEDNNIWDSASYKQDIYQGISKWNPVPLTTEQQITYTVKPTSEDVSNPSYFNLFFEIWAQYPNGQLAEMMVQQRVVSNGYAVASVGTYQVYGYGSFGQYFISYHAPDIPFNEWTTKTYDLNTLLFSQLPFDNSQGKVYAFIFGIEGHGTGSMAAQWSQMNYEKQS